MVIGKKIALLSALMPLIPVQAWAKDSITLEPSSQWVVDFSPDRCSIMREFGSDSDRTILKMTTVVPDRGFDLTLIGRYAKVSRPERGIFGHIEVSFSPDGPKAGASVTAGETGIGPAFVAQGLEETGKGVDPSEDRFLTGVPERFARMEQIEFTDGLWRFVALKTGRMDRVFALLEQCKWRQVAEWRLDVEANRNRVSAPEMQSDNTQVIAEKIQARYPSAALRVGRMATLQLRMIIDVNGRVADCTILSNMKSDEFDDSACETFREYAVYDPAMGADGQPIASWALQTIRYQIP